MKFSLSVDICVKCIRCWRIVKARGRLPAQRVGSSANMRRMATDELRLQQEGFWVRNRGVLRDRNVCEKFNVRSQNNRTANIDRGSMPNVMPSQIVAVVRRFFSHVTTTTAGDGLIHSGQLDVLQGIVNLIREIPTELLVMPPDVYADLVLAIAIIEEQGKFRIGRGTSFQRPAIRSVDVATVIYRALDQCPDEFPPAATTDLLFVADADLRASIRQDIRAVNRAVTHAEWKAATVLAGAAVEALLLWRLSNPPPTVADINVAIASARASGRLTDDPPSNREKWSLSQFVEVMGELRLIKDKTVQAARLCNSYRNLIHPGRARRLGETCNRGTALLAVAALEHVVTDLSPWAHSA